MNGVWLPPKGRCATPILRRSPVIAWSAGAMALADRIVLFHDRSPHGPGHPEVYGSGLSVVRDVVLLPHVGSGSVPTRDAMHQLVIDNLMAWAAGKKPLTPVPETPWPPKRK